MDGWWTRDDDARNEGTKERAMRLIRSRRCDYSISAKNSMVLLSASMNASTSSGRL